MANPELSRRVGRVSSAPRILALGVRKRLEFAARVERAETFADLLPEDRALITKAEQEALEASA
jgi:hypothetical protein